MIPQMDDTAVDWQRLARANTHPLRISILEVLGIDGGRVLSPRDLSYELYAPLSRVNYHVTELARSGLIELVGERAVRGATEHFYKLVDRSSNGGSSNGASNGAQSIRRREPAGSAR
jgi:hypothetical protein